MSIEITHVRYGSTPKSEQTISQVQWRDTASSASGEMGKHALIVWLESQKGAAFVGNGASRAAVDVVQGSPKYVRARGSNAQAATLTGLPEF
ncbi:hypothetical protein [Leucobacter chromiireducens]|uniref:DUF3892 domain-containing protein n=1 Tax=Leucobacter chromiireducens subsp. solipictus TaxID=398235 RepID=A0ABS1SDK2_9MICO|nr:hypothetical protein [Leucobacter chromiireducens]MBL3678609.1 hypothetical protein [Leucobacter chromiireducens subsp. solipictus]